MTSSSELPVDTLRELVREGSMQDAWKILQSTALEPKDWPGGEALHVVAGVVGGLGANRLRYALEWRNWRMNRNLPRFYFQALFGRLRFVPTVALAKEVAGALETVPADDRRSRADLHSMLAWLHARHRDFTPAFRHMDEALDLHGESAWIHVEHSVVLEMADRYDEALAAARRAMSLRPRYHVAVSQCADILSLIGRDDEAIEILTEGNRSTQHPAYAARLQVIYSEREDPVAALACLDRIEALSPMMEKTYAKWIAGRRADFHYMAGDLDACLAHCDLAGEGFHKKLAERLREPGAWKRPRVRLPVPFVRQHRMTCAPATLAAISTFWGCSHDHLMISAAICHEGTPWHKERRWAEENGFVVREFRVTRESLRAVIDRGVPFTLTTSYITSGHMQACVGYDLRAGTVLMRDPTERHFREMYLDSLLESHPVDGPRGMILIPAERAATLDGLELPSEAAYDAQHRLHVALDTNNRAEILDALNAFKEATPDSMLYLSGEASVARWKRDWAANLSALDRMLDRAPDHQTLWYRKAGALRDLGLWRELRIYLEEIVTRKDVDPVFFSELGELLLDDARYLARAEPFLRKAVRRRSQECRVYESLARFHAKRHLHDEACRLRRVASCLAPDHEPYARACFDEYRALGRVTEGLAFLAHRTMSHGAVAAGPWLTMAESQRAVHHDHTAAATLREALAKRPDDGQLLLQAGAMMAGWGDPHRSDGLLWMKRAHGLVPDTQWLREMASIAGFLGDRESAIQQWRELLELQPRNEGAWRNLARLIAEQGGTEAVICLLDDATARFPDLIALWTLKAEWLTETKRGPLESLDRALELDPTDTWLLRERALRRLDAADAQGAEEDAREAVAVNPWSAQSHGILGYVLSECGRRDEAIESMRRALDLDVDYTYAARQLVRLGEVTGDAAQEVRFFGGLLRERVSQGAAVSTYQQLAWAVIAPPPLLKELQDYCGDHPDLWQAWSARIEQALRMRLDGEALAAARVLTDRFPLLPRGWLELARVHRAAGRQNDELAATTRATDLSPGWDEAARAHAAILELTGRTEEAATALRRACQLDPLNGPNYGHLADLLDRSGHRDEALTVLIDGLCLCPYYLWGWNAVSRWCAANGRMEDLRAALAAGREANGHNHAWWRAEADAWDSAGDPAAAMEAVRRGLELAPSDERLREKLAHQLWEADRAAEAIAACDPLPGEAEAPRLLLGRRAWLLVRAGQPLAGVAAMRDLIARFPDYSWIASELAQWHEGRGEWEQLRELCVKWRRACPDELRAAGYLGQAERALGNKEAAIQAFARASAIDPEYTFASRQLFDLQLETGRLEEAADTLKRLEYFATGPHIVGDGIELELRRDDGSAALRRAEALFANEEANAELFDWIGGLFKKSPHASAWRSMLRHRAERKETVAPGALTAFLATLPADRLKIEAGDWIRRHPEGSAARLAGWKFVFRELRRSAARNLTTLRGYATNRVREFHSHPELWNELGQTLVQLNAAQEAVAWYDGWQNRADGEVTASTLLNLAAAFDTLPGKEDIRWQSASEVRCEAFRRFPDDSVAPAIRAGHAFHLAVDGRLDEARTVLADFDEKSTWDYYQSIGGAARAVLAAAGGDTQDARHHLTRAWEHLRKFDDLGTIRLRNRALRSVARHIAGAKGSERKLLAMWKLPKPIKRTDSGGPDNGATKLSSRTVITLALLLLYVLSVASRQCQQVESHPRPSIDEIRHLMEKSAKDAPPPKPASDDKVR